MDGGKILVRCKTCQNFFQFKKLVLGVLAAFGQTLRLLEFLSLCISEKARGSLGDLASQVGPFDRGPPLGSWLGC